MDLDISFQLAGEHGVVQVLDFDPMEYENYGNRTQITLIELQNVASSELFLEAADNQSYLMSSDDLDTISSYASFVRNLNGCETDDFENVTNSTTIEHFKRMHMRPDENLQCRNDCNCERCLQIYFDGDSSDFDRFNVAHPATVASDFENFLYVENITNANLMYDFTRLWEEAEVTEYMEFPLLHDMYTSASENGTLLLENIFFTQSNREGNDTAEAAGFYDTSASDSLMAL